MTTVLLRLIIVVAQKLAVTDSTKDWLIHHDAGFPSVVREHVCWRDNLCGIEISNGILTRRFTVSPAFGTIDLFLHSSDTNVSMFRAIEPEATLVLNHVDYHVGGLTQKDGFRSYFNRTHLEQKISRNRSAFHYVSHHVSRPGAPFPWTPGTRHSLPLPWPPKGITLSVTLAHDSIPAQVTIHYELYDGMPCMSKWITVRNNDHAIIQSVTVERLAANAPFGPYFTHGSKTPMDAEPLLYAITDQAHGASCTWVDDFSHSHNHIGNETWHDEGAVEPLLVCNYTLGPAVWSSEFESFKVILLALSEHSDATRQSLSVQRMTQLLAPHVTENPLFFHVTNVTEGNFERVVDQMAEVGFEMLIYSFGSGFDLENTTQIQHVRQQVQYAKSRGLEVGGYDLICLDRGKNTYGNNVGDEWTAVAQNGNLTLDACFASGWYDKLLGLVREFVKETGITMLETDGPYGGGACASTNHSHHNGWEDSVYQQTRLQNELFRELRSLGIYVNQPDNYFFQGGSRSGMGYSEEQYSLPRWNDLSISRMGLYDDLYRFLPTQGWMFVPLVPYHRGDDAAAFQGHDEEYDWALAQYMGAGTAACYRGQQLYDETTNEGLRMKNTIRKWVNFYKAHRDTLIQPVIHLKRPTMQSWDGWLHVNPFGTKDVGLAMIFNPTDVELQECIKLPLYHTGLDHDALISFDDGRSMVKSLSRDYMITLNLVMKPRSIHVIVVKRVNHQDPVPAVASDKL